MGTRRRHRRRYRGGVEFTMIEGESEADQEKRFKEWQKKREEEARKEAEQREKKEKIEALRNRKVAPLGHLQAPKTVAEIRKISGKTGAGRRTRRRRHTRRRR